MIHPRDDKISLYDLLYQDTLLDAQMLFSLVEALNFHIKELEERGEVS